MSLYPSGAQHFSPGQLDGQCLVQLQTGQWFQSSAQGRQRPPPGHMGGGRGGKGRGGAGQPHSKKRRLHQPHKHKGRDVTHPRQGKGGMAWRGPQGNGAMSWPHPNPTKKRGHGLPPLLGREGGMAWLIKSKRVQPRPAPWGKGGVAQPQPSWEQGGRGATWLQPDVQVLGFEN